MRAFNEVLDRATKSTELESRAMGTGYQTDENRYYTLILARRLQSVIRHVLSSISSKTMTLLLFCLSHTNDSSREGKTY